MLLWTAKTTLKFAYVIAITFKEIDKSFEALDTNVLLVNVWTSKRHGASN